LFYGLHALDSRFPKADQIGIAFSVCRLQVNSNGFQIPEGQDKSKYEATVSQYELRKGYKT